MVPELVLTITTNERYIVFNKKEHTPRRFFGGMNWSFLLHLDLLLPFAISDILDKLH